VAESCPALPPLEFLIPRTLLPSRVLVPTLVGLFAIAGCGTGPAGNSRPTGAQARAATGRVRHANVRLVADRSPAARLPVALQRTAGVLFKGRIIVMGGLDAGAASVPTVTAVSLRSRSTVALAPLPRPVHDAAGATANGSVMLFGGGEAEGTDAVVNVLPGRPHLVGRLPRLLSDAGAAALGDAAYVAGGWDGATLDRSIYRDVPGRPPAVAGRLPAGVRYPAVASLAGKLLVAGGETATGRAVSNIESFDPRSGRTVRAGDLPYAVTDAAGAVLQGRFYVIGGLRGGSPTSTILSWAPGEARAHVAGHLPTPLSDMAAVPTSRAIAVVGGRAAGGPLDTVLLLRPRRPR
jgi:Kelch motif